jgi:hypothetical protein
VLLLKTAIFNGVLSYLRCGLRRARAITVQQGGDGMQALH